MSAKRLCTWLAATLVCISLAPIPAFAQGKPQSLDELLQRVRNGYRTESAENKQREAEFRVAKDQQTKLLSEARAKLARLQAQSVASEKKYNENELVITERKETLRLRLGTMGELFGVIRQLAADTRSHIEGSLVSAQYPGRAAKIDKLARSEALPTIADLESLWFVMQHEMNESGEVVRYQGKVTLADGKEVTTAVTRIGVFNAVANGKYVIWSAETGKLTELSRQPAGRYLSAIEELDSAKGDTVVSFGLDPSKGAILSLLVEAPSFSERVTLGGLVGYIIITLGFVAGLLAVGRLLWLFFVRASVSRQQKNPKPSDNNPLGRILNVYAKDKDASTEILERRLDEAILVESTRLERFMWAVKIVSVVAPLLGLLGTVTGLIRTFQTMTLMGASDPKLMAGGISEALVTTMLGLMIAIPLVLLHSWLKSVTGGIMNLLDEQSAGFIARQAEKDGGRATVTATGDDEGQGAAAPA